MNTKKLIEAIKNTFLQDCDDLVAQSYSGRGMYGRDCVGVTLPAGVSAFRLAAAISAALLDMDSEEGPSDVEELSRLTVREDSMGRDSIVYFPNVPWTAEEEEHDCEGASCCSSQFQVGLGS